MKNRIVGYIIIGVAILIAFIVYSFNKALTDIVNTACSHGPECPMWGTINFHTNVSIGITVVVALIGIYLVFFGRDEKIVIKTIRKKEKKKDYSAIVRKLKGDEKTVIKQVVKAEGTIFQSDLVDKTGLTKVKMTRILDKLEGKGIIERRRRGMTNVVILKQ
ncbi:MAG: MarR family transcriptional regulator [Candidatus Woesearchaeota archaeon]